MQRVSQVEMLNFSGIVQTQRQTESVTEKNITNEEAITKNINNIRNETGLDSIKDPLNTNRAASNETNLLSEISNTINN